jgi:hypothetical protein
MHAPVFYHLDNDGADDPGVQIFALQVASNIINDSYLQQLEQASGLSAYRKA